MGCGASHSRVEPTSDGTFVNLRNLEKGISLAGALAPTTQLSVVTHDGRVQSVLDLTPITDASTCLHSFARRDERRNFNEPTFNSIRALRDSTLRDEPRSLIESTYRYSAITRESWVGKSSEVLELSRTTRISNTSTRSEP